MPKYCLTHLLCWVSHTFWRKLIRLYWFGFQVGGEISGFYQCLLTGETHSCSLFLTASTAWRRAAELFSISWARTLDALRDTEVIYHPDPPPSRAFNPHTYRKESKEIELCASVLLACLLQHVCLYFSSSHSPSQSNTHRSAQEHCGTDQ